MKSPKKAGNPIVGLYKRGKKMADDLNDSYRRTMPKDFQDMAKRTRENKKKKAGK